MTISNQGNRRCDKHRFRKGIYTVRDNYGNEIDMCNACRLDLLLNFEILVCKECDVLVVSEDDPRAKLRGYPHKEGCSRYIPPPVVPKFEDFDFYQDSRRRKP